MLLSVCFIISYHQESSGLESPGVLGLRFHPVYAVSCSKDTPVRLTNDYKLARHVDRVDNVNRVSKKL